MAVSNQAFKQALGQFAAGVTMISTQLPGGQQAAFTATAFSSLSLNPPLVLFCLQNRSVNFPLFDQADHWVAHLLKREQEAISNLFAATDPDRFGQVAWQPGQTGQPMLAECLVALECRLHSKIPGGDHTVFVGEVLATHHHPGEPLVYWSGAYRGVK